MKISILGAGNIGGTIGKKWAAGGHEVVFGVRDVCAPKVKQLLDSVEGKASATMVADAVTGSEVVLLAIPGKAVEATVIALSKALDGKIIIDATNKIGQPVMHSLSVLKTHAPNAKLFRVFNSLGWESFAEPVIAAAQADLFYCGDEGAAQTIVDSLITDVGIRPIYIGNLDQAPIVDAVGSLWFALAIHQGHGRHLAFKMLKGGASE